MFQSMFDVLWQPPANISQVLIEFAGLHWVIFFFSIRDHISVYVLDIS
jgi:hypothetical protein